MLSVYDTPGCALHIVGVISSSQGLSCYKRGIWSHKVKLLAQDYTARIWESQVLRQASLKTGALPPGAACPNILSEAQPLSATRQLCDSHGPLSYPAPAVSWALLEVGLKAGQTVPTSGGLLQAATHSIS